MTGPIVFLPTPKAPTTQAADAQASWSSVASTTDLNFQKINDYTRNGKPWPQAFTTKLTAALVPALHTDWQVVGATWPALTITIPQACRGLWIIVSAEGDVTPGQNNYLAASVQITGSGITGIPEPWWLAVGGNGMTFGASRILGHPGNLLVPGQTVTFTPVYIHGVNHAPANPHLDGGEVFVITML